ncbi:MAG: aromatic ring-hydroxylating oxygenase subunit alpha [Pikeienuella sp.]|uniref:aromatic ring-hydroxylating oxygenase subunit alpha n=1 Tax=Pikeienuella sp. TaxID=2831957 RepID=UPI00391D4681
MDGDAGRATERAEGFNGLKRAAASLPAAWYGDPAQHAREMAAIWRKGWVAFARAEALAAPGARLAAPLAGMNVLALRDGAGALRAFHNVCRHRGAELCPEGAGRIAGGRISCPYHDWTYAEDGLLLATGKARAVEGFDRAGHGLVPLGVAEWGGFVFVNAAGGGQGDFAAAHGPDLAPLAPWRPETLAPVHSETIDIDCDWKLFWENFNECLHCPGVHPALSALVPIYGRGIMEREDDPAWRDHGPDAPPALTGRLREGAESWTEDGRAAGPRLPGLADDDAARGQTYAVILPSFFMVGHVDHARPVRVLPLGPGRTRLEATWLAPPDAGIDGPALAAFAKRVMAEDAAACEGNQRGLRAAPFEAGVLMQEEYEIAAFHGWLRARLES